MAAALTLLASATDGGCRRARYGDFVIVTLQNAAFAVTAQDLQIAENWARSRTSLGNTHRDREAFINRFETILARQGSAIASKGSIPVLARIVKGMTANGVQLGEWSIPHNINESVEVKKPNAALLAAMAGEDAAKPS